MSSAEPSNVVSIALTLKQEFAMRGLHREQQGLYGINPPDFTRMQTIWPRDFIPTAKVLPIRDRSVKSAEQLRPVCQKGPLYEGFIVVHR